MLFRSAFQPLEKLAPKKKALENDYAIRGRILSWREIRNEQTNSPLLVFDVETDKLRLEVVASRAELKGDPVRGGWLSADVWLQGHILTDRELQLRYEGIDREAPRDLLWQKLRRDN